MSAKFSLLFVALMACTSEPPTGAVFASPADGQSAFDRDGTLVVSAPLLALPQDYPTPQAIRVVDLSTDGFVDGSVTTAGGLLTFTPSDSWRRNARYAWTVDVPNSLPHGPQFEADDGIEDAAIFDTSDSLTALAAGRQEGLLCVVMSRTPSRSELNGLTLDLDDEAIEDAQFELLDVGVWEPELEGRSDGDPGLGVACTGAGDASFARLYTSDTDSSLVEISSDSPNQLVAALYRSAP
ncbi:MAG: hypothetical protein ACJAZO_003116 [Myxococcota bacterium]|jgi:hypothetical protein